MSSNGIILNYDSTKGTGQIMMSNGEKINFIDVDWADTSTQPAIHQKITYENTQSPMHIKVITQKPDDVAPSTMIKPEANKILFTNVDDYINHFTKKGFKLIRDTQDAALRTLTLRSFSVEEFAEVIIQDNGSNISIKHTCNGKPVLT